MILGCDISVFQGSVDFDQLRNAVDFVIVKASYGNGYIDPDYSVNRKELHDRSICKGYYGYAYPQYNSAEAEAAWFLKTIGTPDEGDVLALDYEEHWTGDPVSWCKSWLDYVSQNTNGTKPVLYLNQSLMNGYNWAPVIAGGYGLWLAEYDNNPNGLMPKTPWPVLAFRQYGSTSKFPGVQGNVDGDVFYGDKTVFAKYGYHPAPNPVTPPPTPVTPEPAPQPPVTPPTPPVVVVTSTQTPTVVVVPNDPTVPSTSTGTPTHTTPPTSEPIPAPVQAPLATESTPTWYLAISRFLNWLFGGKSE